MSLFLLVSVVGCRGEVEAEVPPRGEGLHIAEVALRRLSTHEYDAVLADVLLDDARPGRSLLPADSAVPFDNDWTTQSASLALVEAAESLAGSVAASLIDDPDRLDAVLPCMPTSTTDADCFGEVVRVVGRRLLRRPLDDDDVERFVDLGLEQAATEGAVEAGLELILRALLQDPAFLYRVEVGAPVDGSPGVYRLDGYEVASRLSFLLWASAPDDALLDAAGAGELDTPAGIAAWAVTLLADGRARDQVDRFHAMWLGYDTLPHEPWLTDAMRSESRALVERVVFDEARPWVELFTFEQSWLDPGLADHYGVAGPGTSPGWVDADPDRRGLLGTGSFLSVGSGVADTSPTRRGKIVRERLLCSPVAPPPPGVDADQPPDGDLGQCKEDRYSQHRDDPACSACHALMDPVGFGLENYDREGVWRDHDDGEPGCVISGQGDLTPYGSFAGPAELGARVVEAQIDACVVQQVLQFAIGRPPDPADDGWLNALIEGFRGGDHRFDQLLIDIVADPAFGYRREVSP